MEHKRQEKLHEESLLVQRLMLFLLANSILFLGFVSMGNSWLQTTLLRFVVPGAGVICCIGLVVNAWRVRKTLNALDKELCIPLPQGISKIFAGRKIGFWLAALFIMIWGFSFYYAASN